MLIRYRNKQNENLSWITLHDVTIATIIELSSFFVYKRGII